MKPVGVAVKVSSGGRTLGMQNGSVRSIDRSREREREINRRKRERESKSVIVFVCVCVFMYVWREKVYAHHSLGEQLKA